MMRKYSTTIKTSESMPFLRLFSKNKQSSTTLEVKDIILEILYLATLVLSYFRWEYSFNTIEGIVLFVLWSLILLFVFSLAYENLQSRLLPDKLVRWFAVFALAYQIINIIVSGNNGLIIDALVGVLLVGGIPYLLFLWSQGKWIGGGDVKYGATAGLLLGYQLGLACLVVMALIVSLGFIYKKIMSDIVGNKKPIIIGTGVGWALSVIICFLLLNNFVTSLFASFSSSGL